MSRACGTADTSSIEVSEIRFGQTTKSGVRAGKATCVSLDWHRSPEIWVPERISLLVHFPDSLYVLEHLHARIVASTLLHPQPFSLSFSRPPRQQFCHFWDTFLFLLHLFIYSPTFDVSKSMVLWAGGASQKLVYLFTI